MNWIKRIFLFAGPTPAPVQEVLYCKKDGTLLTVTKQVLEFSPYTGLPSIFRTVKTCPVCGTEIESTTTGV
jgi:hypothetical protein